MSRKGKSTHTVKRVTKSIRLSLEEADELRHLVEETAYAEAALMRQWVLKGMQQFRIHAAISAYQEGHVDLRAAAERARLPVAALLEEMATRKVAVIDREDAFGPGLEELRSAFGEEGTQT